MKRFLNEIRKPMPLSVSKKWLYSILIFFVGALLGVFTKILDETPSNDLPFLLEIVDLGNFFSRMGFWIFAATLISLYSKSPIRAAINVFLFFAAMVGSYYYYTITVAGFFPKNYMMIWVAMTIISPFLAFVCWYAKGKGILSTIISVLIILFMARQTFAFGFWYLDIRDTLEFILLIATVFILYQTRKQIIYVVTIGLLLFFLTAQTEFFWGIL